MKMSNGGFDVQAVVETDNHIITEFGVTSDATDRKQLEDMTQKAKEAVNKEHIEVLTDDGYVSHDELQGVIENGDIPQVPAPKAGCFEIKFDDSTEVGKQINHGILPEHLEGKSFEIIRN